MCSSVATSCKGDQITQAHSPLGTKNSVKLGEIHHLPLQWVIHSAWNVVPNPIPFPESPIRQDPFQPSRLSASCCCCYRSVTHSCPILWDPLTAACQASLSFTIFRSLIKLRSIELMMPSNHLIFCVPPFPFALNLSQHQVFFQWVSGGQSIGPSASASVLPIFRTDFL